MQGEIIRDVTAETDMEGFKKHLEILNGGPLKLDKTEQTELE